MLNKKDEHFSLVIKLKFSFRVRYMYLQTYKVNNIVKVCRLLNPEKLLY